MKDQPYQGFRSERTWALVNSICHDADSHRVAVRIAESSRNPADLRQRLKDHFQPSAGERVLSFAHWARGRVYWEELAEYYEDHIPGDRDHSARGYDGKRYGSRQGQYNSRAKLTEEQVLDVLSAPADVTNVELASRYGVAASTIQQARTGRTWKHLSNTKE